MIGIGEETKIGDFKVYDIDVCVSHVVHHLFDRSCQRFRRCLINPIFGTQYIGGCARACFEPGRPAWVILCDTFGFIDKLKRGAPARIRKHVKAAETHRFVDHAEYSLFNAGQMQKGFSVHTCAELLCEDGKQAASPISFSVFPALNVGEVDADIETASPAVPSENSVHISSMMIYIQFKRLRFAESTRPENNATKCFGFCANHRWVPRGRTPSEDSSVDSDRCRSLSRFRRMEDRRNGAVRERIARLRIELQELEPKIWRRIDVPLSMTLEALHEAIQMTMGWTSSHLWEFDIDGPCYGDPSFREFDDEPRVGLRG